MTKMHRVRDIGIRLLVALAGASVAACAGLDRSATADDIARPAGLARSQDLAGQFVLTTFGRSRAPGSPLTVYIEGDGLAWLSRTEVSPDPTPRNPVGLRLAAADPSPNVLYVARPCQYAPPSVDRRCANSDYWTDRRFAEEVVASVDAAVTRQAGRGARGVRLVGYSGGGAVAVLVAARRNDVIDVRTVAGNLDHVALNRHHGVSQQRGSLNAADVAAKIASIPQLHLIGSRDEIVVPSVAESYARRAGTRGCIELRTVPGATHADGWVEAWRAAVSAPVRCR